MGKRKSGVLLHITSLPNTPGIGTLGKEAYKFADWLHEANQTYWQVLPLGPTGYGDSPYASFSTFAGNPLIIDLDNLAERGWANRDDIVPPEYIKTEGKIDFGSVVWWKTPVLYKCAEFFLANAQNQDKTKYEEFKAENLSWLDNYASYTSIKKYYDAQAQEKGITGKETMWNSFWPKGLACHNYMSVSKWNNEHKDDIEKIKVIQFFFFVQWKELKEYVNKLGIKIIGDIPIFVAADSADVWANQKFFDFDKDTLQQKSCAGVPPDYFSATGQLWGNPLYNWDAMKKDHYSWWVSRIQNMMNLVDLVRIDHFRGFEAFWQIPYGEPTAVNGKWVKGPNKDLFDTIKKKLGNIPIIAEDLGVITPEVEELRDGCGFPGMKILQFAFNANKWNEESAAIKDLPHNYITPNIIVYTGTHDNDTTAGFFASCDEECRNNVRNYLGLSKDADAKDLAMAFVKSAYASVANTCIIPLQDVYALDSDARMNTPSTTGANWAWRMEGNLLNKEGSDLLKTLSLTYGRNLPEKEL